MRSSRWSYLADMKLTEVAVNHVSRSMSRDKIFSSRSRSHDSRRISIWCHWVALMCWITSPVQGDDETLPVILRKTLADAPSVNPPPSFILEPEEVYYVVRTKPATITCRAIDAEQINVKCIDQWVQPTQQVTTHGVESRPPGRKYIQTSVDIIRDDVEEFHNPSSDGGYWCECHALNHVTTEQSTKQWTKSRRTSVHLANLRKTFDREPLKTYVELQSTAELQCLPPQGIPTPEVFWLKDGEIIDTTKDINFIVSSEGNLMISQARFSDTGNYTCGAQNIANKRFSEPALLTVYVNGGWSEWSAWSNCSGPCGRGLQRRHRTCTDPAPVHEGEPCPGEDHERAACGTACSNTADGGGWTTWSTWTTCDLDCRQYRRRVCGPTGGGSSGMTSSSSSSAAGQLICDGTDLDAMNCTREICTMSAAAAVGTDVESSKTSQLDNSNDLTVYIGLLALLALLIVITFSTVILLYRSQRSSGLCYGRSKLERKVTQELKQPPDITHTVLPYSPHSMCEKPPLRGASVADAESAIYAECQLQSSSDETGSTVGRGRGAAVIKLHKSGAVSNGTACSSAVATARSSSRSANSYLLYKQGNDNSSNIVVASLSDSRSPVRGQGHTTMAVSGDRRMSGSDVKTLDDGRGGGGGAKSDYNTIRRVLKMAGGGIGASVESDALAWASVTHAGIVLTLPRSGVALTVPDGAVRKGNTQITFIAVLRDDKDRPKLTDSQTLLSPVLLVGPGSAQLSKPLVLTFHHCANIKHGHWTLTVIATDAEPLCWQPIATIGDESYDTSVCLQLELNRCHVMTDRPMRYALLGEPHPVVSTSRQSVEPSRSPASSITFAVKLLRLGAFAQNDVTSGTCNLRVYFVDDTIDAFEGVVQVERKLGGRLLAQSKQFQFHFQTGVGANLCLGIEQLSPGWRSKVPDNYQEIPFWHIWSCTQNALHCSFALERFERSAEMAALSCDVHVLQQTMPANQQILQVTWTQPENPVDGGSNKGTPRRSTPGSTNGSHRRQHATIDSTNGVSVRQAQQTTTPIGLPLNVRRQLCVILDQPNSRGNDWRMLAQRLSFDRHLSYLATKASPTDHILTLWEARHRDIQGNSDLQSAVNELMNSLRAIGRSDAASIIDKYLQNPWV